MERGVYVKILRLGLPILAGQLGMILVGFADTKMLGMYSTAALASSSFVNNLFNVCIFACIGFTYGITPLAGALYGQQRKGAIGELLKNGLLLNILFTLGVSGVMTAIYLNLDKMGQPEELLPLIRPYYLIYLSGLIPLSLFNVFAQWSYAINRTKMPMWIILGSNGLNIFGNWLLIYGHWGFPELGLNGAGYSTLISRILCPLAIMLVFFLRKEYRDYSDGFKKGRVSRLELATVWRTSLPVALQMTFESGSFTGSAIMAGWLGAVPLAAYQVIIILGTLGFCVYYSIASAVSVLVSNATGQDDRRAMRGTAMAGYKVLLVLATISSGVFYFFGKPIIMEFTHDPAVLGASFALILPLILYQYGDATQINFSNALRGTSRVMPMIWIAFVSYIVVGLPVTYLFGFTLGGGLYGIVLSFSVSLFLAAGLFLWFFLRATRNVVKPDLERAL